MQKIIFVMAWLSLVSCHDPMSFSPTEKPKVIQTAYLMSKEPRIYLSQQQRFINFKELNRSKLDLNLSDQIIFSEEKKEDASIHLDKLENFKKDEDFKIKISSFCAYTNSKPDQASGASTEKAVREVSSLSYHWSFSVFELLPAKMLLDGLDRAFYCSFIFAFKNEQGAFDYYSIVQTDLVPH